MGFSFHISSHLHSIIHLFSSILIITHFKSFSLILFNLSLYLLCDGHSLPKLVIRSAYVGIYNFNGFVFPKNI